MASERRSVAVFVFRAREPRFLLLHRVPERGGFWQPVTGRVEETDGRGTELEGLAACAAREVREETGIEDVLSVVDLALESTFTGYDGTLFRERAFAAEVPADAVAVRSHEHDDLRWVEADEALALLHWEENREALRRLLGLLAARPEV